MNAATTETTPSTRFPHVPTAAARPVCVLAVLSVLAGCGSEPPPPPPPPAETAESVEAFGDAIAETLDRFTDATAAGPAEAAPAEPTRDAVFTNHLRLATLHHEAGRTDAAREALAPLMNQTGHPRFGEVLTLLSQIDGSEAPAGPADPPAGPVAGTPTAAPPAGAVTAAPPDASPKTPPAAPPAKLPGGGPPQDVWVVDGEAVVQKTLVTPLEAARTEKRIRSIPEAAAALDYLTKYVRRFKVPEAYADDFAELREELETEAEAGRYRIGRRFVDADEYERIVADGDASFRQAARLLEEDQYASAYELLRRAGRMNPADVRSSFLAGLLASLPDVGEAEAAREHFSDVLAVRPEHTGAMHNMGLLSAKARRYTGAIRMWEQVADRDGKSPHLRHNLLRLIGFDDEGRITLDAEERRRLDMLLTKLEGTAEGELAGCRGYAFMPSTAASFTDARGLTSSGEPLRLLDRGYGSGFVVAPGLVVTNRHVVLGDGGEVVPAVKVALPDGGRETVLGRVLAVAADRDLALVEAPGLAAPPLQVRDEEPARSEDLMIFGYPLPTAMGVSLKATRGVVTGAPSVEKNGMFTTDAAASPGNSGGPVVDDQGRVIGVLTAKDNPLFQLLSKSADYTYAVSAEDLRAFLERSAPPRPPAEPRQTPADWAAVDRLVAASTVMLTACDVEDRLDVTLPFAKSYTLEDRTCPSCMGKGFVGCTGCTGGNISYPQQVRTGYNRLTKRPIYTTKYFKRDCPSCRNGTVACPGCRGAKYLNQ